MALRLPTPVEKVFPLLEADQTGQTTVTVRQATQRAVAALGDMISRIDRTTGANTYATYFNPARSQMLQAFHTIVACNIEGADGKLLFPSKTTPGGTVLAMDEKQFENAWYDLPPEWVSEIMDFVAEMNPMWDYSEGKG